MRVNQEFLLKEIAGSFVVIPVSSILVDFDGMITLNETGVFLWRLLEEDRTFEELLAELQKEYDVDEKTAREDITAFLDEIRAIKALEE
ncbi:PqqD family protein [Acetivibrio sp. MSJd-27]|jgi:hypothetical protein|uniref:PqqD family protein n=1 Tax=Acetivibrio sp. MSJd-27 TaxID=2841523 RepID=UPI0015B3441D|nr:PqqD family protein [Acetivibrio sp. MSJd-27]MBU5450565.1 PqqD family protein [Acetivibrio sp. MSJd-27]